MFDDWLDDATPADLEALAQSLLDNRIPTLSTGAAIQLAGFGQGAVRFLQHLVGTDPKVVAWTLQRLARERRKADDRYAQVAQLVWSGAADDGEAIRDTRVVLDDLFRRAEQSVLLATYVIYDGRSVFRSLFDRLRQLPNLHLDFYVNLPATTGREEHEGDDVDAYLSTFCRLHWPGELPLPNLYYDPETRRLGVERTSLHAKCVVVDERWAFVTSANFTEAAQERNIETGVLLDHPKLAQALTSRFRALREAGIIRPMRG
jgi:phosphatidylserine/phosphatidylglycerophosphate/cardiolipin synthase-like enzyme